MADTSLSSSSSSWPPEFSDLKRLEALLICGICYDYMKNPVITSCSHTYCSQCIRMYMQVKNKCPVCSSETHENQLRTNRLVDEIILVFLKVKVKLTKALMITTVATVSAPESQTQTTPVKKSPSKPVVKSSPVVGPPTPEPGPSFKPVDVFAGGNDVILNGVKVPGIFNCGGATEKRPTDLVNCPVCQAEVSSSKINAHLDQLCLRAAPAPKAAQHRKRPPLPKRLYHLMKDKDLKKCMKDLGLNVNGDRKTLISRIQKYTVMYNAENDAPNPRPASELIAQLEREEVEQKKPQNLISSMMKRIPIDRKSDPELIDKVNKAYREEQKESFKKLIENMRARDGRNIKPLKPAPRVYSDDESDPYRPSTSNEGDAIVIESSDSEPYPRPTDGAIDWSRTEISETDDDDELDPSSFVTTSWHSPVKNEEIKSNGPVSPDMYLSDKDVEPMEFTGYGVSPVKQESAQSPLKYEQPSEESPDENEMPRDKTKMMWNSDDDESSIEMSIKPKKTGLSKSCDSSPNVDRGSKRRLAYQGPGEPLTSPLRSFDKSSLLKSLDELKEEALNEKTIKTTDDETPPSRSLRSRIRPSTDVKQVERPARRSSVRKKSKLQ